MNWKQSIITGLSLAISFFCQGQGVIAPVNYNPFLNKQPKPLAKTTTLNLPFFEDFTGYDVFPDNTKWTDRSVYVNNTMGLNPVSRGVATFDALNAQGGPYDSVNQLSLLYADSLTSQPIDLSLNSPGDSIYLSFFFQPQGRGFAPETQDSLMLYLKKLNGWVKVWSVQGSLVQPFRQVMIPVADAACFHNDFQFRFVNKASINVNDDIWNIDYIRLAANRSMNDTAVNDVAATDQPTNLLNDYTAMPYRQFSANVNGELAVQHAFSVGNWYNIQQSVVYGYTAREKLSNTPLFTSGISSAGIGPYSGQQFQFPVYNTSYTAPGPYSKVVFEHKYFIGQPPATGIAENDTIVYDQVFDNYLAYDDGTAEKSYFIHQGTTLPAKTAVEFHLNQPDTLRGVAIYFGRQVPMAFTKFFSVFVNKDIAVNGGTNDSIYQQDLYFPGYVDTVNHFWIYKFDEPVPVNAGTFFLGTIQPAMSGSDSLYFGLDVNRLGGNHLYVDYQGYWQPENIPGVLMIRPLLGQPVIGTAVETPGKQEEPYWSVYPNPAREQVSIRTEGGSPFRYEITDMQGRVLLRDKTVSSRSIDISTLTPGIYFVRILAGTQISLPKKIIKL